MYPLQLLQSGLNIHQLFKNLSGFPYVFDFANNGSKYNTQNFQNFQTEIFSELISSDSSWGIGRYLENREKLLRAYPQMIREGRMFHAGVDIIVPGMTPLFAPIDSTVFLTGHENGLGNYGGFVILQHQIWDEIFFSFYGHLKTLRSISKGLKLKAGTQFSLTGSSADETGGWFTHTHLQILTERAFSLGREMNGYVTAEDLKVIENIFPNPYPLMKF